MKLGNYVILELAFKRARQGKDLSSSCETNKQKWLCQHTKKHTEQKWKNQPTKHKPQLAHSLALLQGLFLIS